MKIGLVLSNPPAYSETFFISKIKGLQKNGFEVVLFVNKNTEEFNLCRVKPQVRLHSYHIVFAFVQLLFRMAKHPKTFTRFIQLEKAEGVKTVQLLKKLLINQHILSENKVDWLHFGFATMALGKESIASAIGAKMAVSLRGFDIGIYPLKHLDCYNLLWKRIDKLHVISNDLLELAYQNGCSKETPFQKITPAIDVAFFSSPKESQSIPELQDTKIKFLTVGRLHWKKGYENMLLALKELKTQGISFSYTIVGTGTEEERIKYTVYDLDLTEEVVFTGKLSREETKREFEKSDVYIQYSVQEGFCNAVLEAQSMGVLPIVSDAEGLSENVINNQTGWVVPKNKPTLLAQKIQAVMLLTRAEKENMIKNATERVKQDFNIKEQEQAFVSFYKKR